MSSCTVSATSQPTGAAPLNRGKPPLFARAHRKTVPPVANVTLPAAPVGAARFSALVEAVEGTSNAVETEAVPPADVQPQQQQARLPQPLFRPFHTQQEQYPQQAQQPQPRTQPLATPVPASAPAQPTGFAAALQRSNTAAKPLSLPRVQTPEPAPAPALAPDPKSQSILGKLFRAQVHAQPAPHASAPADSLESMFQRLRGPVAPAPASVNSGAGSWLAKRDSSS